MLINRHLDTPLSVRLTGIRARQVSAEVVTGPSVDATNESGSVVRLVPLPAVITNDDITLTLPPHAVAGVRIESP